MSVSPAKTMSLKLKAGGVNQAMCWTTCWTTMAHEPTYDRVVFGWSFFCKASAYGGKLERHPVPSSDFAPYRLWEMVFHMRTHQPTISLKILGNISFYFWCQNWKATKILEIQPFKHVITFPVTSWEDNLPVNPHTFLSRRAKCLGREATPRCQFQPTRKNGKTIAARWFCERRLLGS